MCISRLCQYFFLSSFLCALPIAPWLSFSNCASTVSPFLTTSVCSSQLSAHSISSTVCPPSCSFWDVRAHTRDISRRSHLHLLSLQAKHDCGATTWGLIEVLFFSHSPLWGDRGRMMRLAVKFTSTEHQHKYSHWGSYFKVYLQIKNIETHTAGSLSQTEAVLPVKTASLLHKCRDKWIHRVVYIFL